ncbi:DUF418 domain-containing protein [Deinococcus sp. LM3]|uniref:DUF418 domain-containing protein n=1 Tax=Deinococcus sp. LM3 TaxID=1938608 RepID=UPI001180585C|nr:DUF418 domain-containing protein [Deinococcus sp. LM3]
MGLPLGLGLAYLNTRTDVAAGMLALPVRMAGGLAGALGYVGVLGLLAASGRLGAWRLFAASGRMALTNYLTQSVVMTLIFYPYALHQGFGWVSGTPAAGGARRSRTAASSRSGARRRRWRWRCCSGWRRCR